MKNKLKQYLNFNYGYLVYIVIQLLLIVVKLKWLSFITWTGILLPTIILVIIILTACFTAWVEVKYLDERGKNIGK